MLNLRVVNYCLATCFLICAAPGISAPPAPKLEAGDSAAAFAFSKAIQKRDVAAVANALRTHLRLANAPLVNKNDRWVGSPNKLPLSLAAFEGSTPIVTLLIDSGANVNAEDNVFGKTALDDAVTFHYPEVATLLLAHGANIEFKDTAGIRALHEAVIADDPVMVALLLAHGANVNAQDVEGETALGLLRNPNIRLQNHAAILAVLQQYGAKK